MGSDLDEQPPVTTLLERMLAAGLDEERARGHITRGVVRVDGEPVLDPDTPVPWPTAWVVGSG